MSRTYHHNARRDLYIMVPETGYFACNWGALAKRFIKHRVHRLERRYAQRELHNALREADSLEVALLRKQEDVHAQVLHHAHDKYCTCASCLMEFEDSWNESARYSDSCGDPYREYCRPAPVCAHCGQYECEGTCPESYSEEDAYYDRIYQQEITYYRGDDL